MNKNKGKLKIRDMVFDEIAARYVERYGAVLQRELAAGKTSSQMGGAKRKTLRTNTSAEEKIKRSLQSARRKDGVFNVLLFASLLGFLAVIFATTGIYSWFASGWKIATGGEQPGSVLSGEPATLADDGGFGEPVADGGLRAGDWYGEGETEGGGDVYDTDGSGPDGPEGGEPDNITGADGGDTLPERFVPGPGYEIVNEIRDSGRLVYFIANENQDNIVMSEYRGAIKESDTAGLTHATFAALDIYYSFNAYYSKIVYESGDNVRELTCKFDLNTLLDFISSIDPGARRQSQYKTVYGGPVEIGRNYISQIPLKSAKASYINVQRQIAGGKRPSPATAMIEELLNSFEYEKQPTDENFNVSVEIGKSPFDENKALAFIHIATCDLDWGLTPATSVTFLLKTSAGMYSFDKLPLVQDAIWRSIEKLKPSDAVSIIAYDAFGSEVMLDGAAGGDKEAIKTALDGLKAGGLSDSEIGIYKAFTLAEKNRMPGGNNVVIAVTDEGGLFGLADAAELAGLVDYYEKDGTKFCVLGVGGKDLRNSAPPAAGNAFANYRSADSPEAAADAIQYELSASMNLLASEAVACVEFNGANVKNCNLIGYKRSNRGAETTDVFSAGAGSDGAASNASEGSGAGGGGTVPAEAAGAGAGAIRAPPADDAGSDAADVFAGDEIALIYELTPREGVSFRDGPGQPVAVGTAGTEGAPGGGSDAEANASGENSGAGDAGANAGATGTADAGATGTADGADAGDAGAGVVGTAGAEAGDAGAGAAGAGNGSAVNVPAYSDELFELRISAGRQASVIYKKVAKFDDYRDENSADFKFACSVAAFGSVLCNAVKDGRGNYISAVGGGSSASGVADAEGGAAGNAGNNEAGGAVSGEGGLISGADDADASFALIESLAEDGLGGDADGRRAFFTELLRRYDAVARSKRPTSAGAF